MRSLRFETGSGSQIVLGKELARGGEGVVFEVEGDSEIAAKMYHQGKAADRREKVSAMVSAQWHCVTSNAGPHGGA